ncbi:GNAT family N-acetyltransferase [Streptomyces roseifaciens]|uniref:GNAT family N-acetyltransferase n=1 Tax=Streptomyces roseifaciens TaxID=1488406 RepID=UPI000717ED02|nr:GNAT family N-acetyltransferase [Streptomyces roseifaciens]
MVSDLVRVWASGWALSRQTPRPAEHPWGVYIEVGQAEQAGRHVIFEAHESAVRAAAGSVGVPHTWLKVPTEPEDVRPWLPGGWVVDEEETGHLMAVDLSATEPVAPEGYTESLERSGGVTFVRVHDAAGELAAKGQVALLGHEAVVDRVVTEEAHRRRGLGAFVMRTLSHHAVAGGASLGVLGATDEGRALYETLGWKAHARLAACVYRP